MKTNNQNNTKEVLETMNKTNERGNDMNNLTNKTMKEDITMSNLDSNVTKVDKKQEKKERIIDILGMIDKVLAIVVLTFLAANCIKGFVIDGKPWFRPFFSLGNSMNPTLPEKCVGISLMMPSYKAGDIVSVIGEDENKVLHKRIIGVPGDHVEYKYSDEDGHYEYFVNGVKIVKDYNTNNESVITSKRYPCLDVVLGEDEYFVAGDNRTNSYDSRRFGPITESQIGGRTVFYFGL